MGIVRDMKLIDASVRQTATFAEAAGVLCATEVSAIAVLDDTGRVVGLFTDDDLLRGMFPGYIGDLHHTAFLDEDAATVAAHIRKAGNESVVPYMRRPATVELESSGTHVAERFLHCEWGALAVVEHHRYVGMLDQVEFCRAILRRANAAGS